MKNYIKTSKINYKPTIQYLILSVMFLLIGIGIIVGISVNESLKTGKISNYIVTTGIVVDYKVYESNYGNSNTHKVYAYAEIAQFKVDGITYNVTNNVGSTYPANNIGDSIKIAYNPKNPNGCVFIAQSNTLFTILLGVFGVLFMGVGVVLLVYYVQKYREGKKQIY